ncbi:uncharacterized protein MICPUCDRAFT_58801 [Micromonas pusilla CCMP1545]|jgi:hypothetical protein|uniref:Predicted protein n=1 Tax=Micromonas pusilla (strain CCMP1545) TaxID=564608 RepID=C1MUG8_MICPC|nr:uncharacterized protein MICPUCDRAFT_58801 [Micromonas pusilla CCMP1545]EEH56327.1 predicted protein [Micromonas pusilla CCMP1545]|eukprot:XP_003059195.1 predicted protein [Micromonas pusilla CCMP1545]
MTAPKAREEATDALLKAHDAVVERRRDVAGVGASGEDEDAASGGRKTSRADGGGGGGGAGSFEVTFTSDPSAYRVFDKHVREGCDGGGRLEVVTMAVMEGGASGAAASFGALDASASASASRAGGGGGDADADAGAGAFATGAVSSALEAAAGHGHGHGQGQGQGPPRSARPVAPRRRDDGAGLGADAPAAGTTTLYAKGAIAGLPDEHESRRARFAPLDDIQPGWRVELRQKPGSSIVDAVFFSPEDVGYKSFADARREALRSSKHGN